MNNYRAQACKAILALLEESGIAYCALNGTGDFPQTNHEDFDVLISDAVAAEALIENNRQRIGAQTVRRTNGFFVLLCDDGLSIPQFLLFDMATDCNYFQAGDLLAARVRRNNIWVAAPGQAFCLSLGKAVGRAHLSADRASTLSSLFAFDHADCIATLGSLLDQSTAKRVTEAASSGDWADVRPYHSSTRLSHRHVGAGWGR
jgi:hypothetical protein